MINKYGIHPTRVVHCKKARYDVYIGRGPGARGKWGNPYIVGRDGTLEQVLMKYEMYIRTSPLFYDLHELKDKILGCWCAPLPCHGDVLIWLLKELAYELYAD